MFGECTNVLAVLLTIGICECVVSCRDKSKQTSYEP